MKIWENNAFSDYQANQTCNIKLREGPDYIFIDGFAHDKQTLSPVFATNYRSYSYHTSSCHLENNVSIPHYSTDYNLGSSSNHFYSGPYTINTHVTSHGQSNLCGINFKSILPSAYEENIEYSHEANGHHGRIVAIDKTENYKRVRFLYHRDADWYYCKSYFLHEDEEYVYGFHSSHDVQGTNQYTHRFFQLAKDGSSHITGGFTNYYSHNFAMLYKDDNYFVYSQSTWNFSGSRPAFGIRKINFSDTFGTGGWNKYRDSGNNNAGYTLLRQYIPSESGGYTTGTGQIYEAMPLSDGNTLNLKSGFYHSMNPAIIHNHDSTNGLRVKNNVARMYYPMFNANGFLQILRVNLPIDEHELAIDAPIFDIRLCLISTNGLHTENIHYNDFRKNGDLYASSASSGYNFFNLAYFYDEHNGQKRHFLILTGDQSDGLGAYSIHEGATRAWVFEISGFDDALVDDLHETDSLNLTLVQKIDVTEHKCYQSFRPDYDPKKWIAFVNNGQHHDIYTWNPSLKKFQTTTSVNGRLVGMATDTTGRFYTIHNNRDRHFEIHVEALDYPARIVIEPEDTRLEYISSNITTKITISAFNYEGTEIDLNNVTLKINGKNAKFDNNNTTKTLNLSKDSVKQETITISGQTELDITATLN
jgi:hypothetical protein